MTLIGLDVPVDPDADQARQWLTDELAEPIYHQAPSLLERLLTWLLEQLDAAQQTISGVSPMLASAVVAGVAVVVVALALLIAGPVRRARRAARGSHEVLGDDLRTAAELRAAADASAAAGRYDLAVLDRFRAILRGLEERVVLDPLPGRTADEASAAAGRRLPERAADLKAAGLLFDAVAYGDLIPGPDDDAWLREVDRAVAQTRPVAAPDPVTAAAG